jgi:23S rRNA (adenine2503-C2)-methyltransferase
MRCIKELSLPELKSWLIDTRAPGYRAKQIFHWLYRAGVRSFEEMSDLPGPLRKSLAGRFSLSPLVLTEKLVSAADRSEKYLLTLKDGHTIESVVMPYPRRCTICVSTQAGCRFHCVFCASGKKGLKRGLSAGEIIEQVLLAKQEGHPITHIVFMGMGEPLDNPDSLFKAIEMFNHSNAFNIGARRMTISTCGIPDGIKRLIDLHLQVELSVSLHAAGDELRSRLMPVNRQYPLKTLIKELQEYIKRTNRQVTFEYIMIDKLNSSDKDALLLAKLLRSMNCKVNLIPFNAAAPGLDFKPPGAPVIARFRKTLADNGVKNTIRDSRGADIRGACGQLSLDSERNI